MAEKIYELIKTKRHVSFAELERLLPGFIKEPPDNEAMCLKKHPNVILWQGVSDEAKGALDELLSTEKIFLSPVNVLVYVIEGKVLPGLRRINKLPRKDSKKKYWMPVVFDTEQTKTVI